MTAPVTPNNAVITVRHAILIAALIQFVNITDFMMVMPLGPDFAKALSIPVSDIGIIGGVYTFAAAIAGLIAALFLDQYARKRAIMICLAGLSIATMAGAVVWDKHSMIGARLLAGAFGGPLSSLSIALIADWVAPAERGRAMGKVMGSFAAASVLGVPFGLELARLISWHAPFVTTGLMGLGALTLVFFWLPFYPAMRTEKPVSARLYDIRRMVSSRIVLEAYAIMALAMLAGFMIIPNISSHIQLNLHYPREYIGLLYLAGGAVSFFGMRVAGALIDRSSATKTVVLFSALLIIAIFTGFVYYPNIIPVPVIFVVFMVAMSGRMVCAQTLTSKIPAPEERGAFMSVQSAVTHFASATGAYISSLILREENGVLLHMDTVGMICMVLALLLPLVYWKVERDFLRRTSTRSDVTVPDIELLG
jgi:predicted MFS family arabinose efflux permease